MKTYQWIPLLILLASVIKPLFAENLNSDVALLKRALSDLHPGYNRYISTKDLESLWTTLSIKSQKTNPLAFYTDVSQLLATLRCEHTKAELPPNLEANKKARFMPFTFKLFDNKMYISESSIGLPKGTEIKTIDGIPIEDILNKIRSHVAVDGYTTHTIDPKIEQDFDLLGSNFEVFYANAVLGLDDFPESFTIQYHEKSKSSLVTEKFRAISFDEWLNLLDKPYRLDFKDAVSVKYQGSTTILTVDTFVNYRQPVNAEELFAEIFYDIHNKSVDKLIVDLRNNGGGSDDAQNALLRHLYNRPFKVNSAAYVTATNLKDWRGTLNTWSDNIFDIDVSQFKKTDLGYQLPSHLLGVNYQLQTPSENHFKGNIILLTSANNSSASAALLAHLGQQENVRLVGSKTGGNQGGTTATIMAFLKLPKSGVTVRIPLIRNQYNIENSEDGMGTNPDIEVVTTIEDWLENIDPQMRKAIEVIHQ